MEGHQGDGTRIFETPFRAVLSCAAPTTPQLARNRTTTRPESTLKRNLWDLPFEAVCLKGSGGRHSPHS